ncbi:MAG: multidrug effflux MFS transporter [Alphaproteobacteria bacterium]|nr:multidrug effflux MFS transporter [Alphaproteobacteria bacterium]
MKQQVIPPIWLIILIVGLPLFSETVYTPSLPDIASALSVSESWVEYTLTIYLLGFAIGTFIWGNLSDKCGHKPCLIAGLIIYILGCLGCYLADSITSLMICRFIQALGGSVGSVLGQAICRDTFQGIALGKIYSTIGGTLSLFPALGPIIGGTIDQKWGWATIFIFLIGFGGVALISIVLFLSETHIAERRERVSLSATFLKLCRDKRAIGFGILVAAANGIIFSYYAEGPFYLIELLEITPRQYGFSFFGIAIASFCSGLIGRKLHNHCSSETILKYGLMIMACGGFTFLCLTMFFLSRSIIILGSILSIMIIMAGITLVTSNSLSLALKEYKRCVGTASSLFGFSYYIGVSLFTGGMGYSHNGTLWLMPLYFCGIIIFMACVNKMMLAHKA